MNSDDISHLRDIITWIQAFLQKTDVQKNYETAATAITAGSDRRKRR